MKEVDYVSLHSKKAFKSVSQSVIVAKKGYLKYCACLGLYSTRNNLMHWSEFSRNPQHRLEVEHKRGTEKAESSELVDLFSLMD